MSAVELCAALALYDTPATFVYLSLHLFPTLGHNHLTNVVLHDRQTGCLFFRV